MSPDPRPPPQNPPHSPPSYSYNKLIIELISNILEEANNKGIALPNPVLKTIHTILVNQPRTQYITINNTTTILQNPYPTTVNPLKPIKPLPFIPPQQIRALRYWANILAKQKHIRLAKMLRELASILSRANNTIDKMATTIAFQLPVPPEHQARIALSIMATYRVTMSYRAAVHAAIQYVKKYVKNKTTEVRRKIAKILGITVEQLYNKPRAPTVLITHPTQYLQLIKSYESIYN